MTRGVRGAAKSRAQPNVFARPGVWQLEAWCGRCGYGESCGAPTAEHPGEFLATHEPGAGRRCTRPAPGRVGAWVAGRPIGRCGWLLSFVWIYQPDD